MNQNQMEGSENIAITTQTVNPQNRGESWTSLCRLDIIIKYEIQIWAQGLPSWDSYYGNRKRLMRVVFTRKSRLLYILCMWGVDILVRITMGHLPSIELTGTKDGTKQGVSSLLLSPWTKDLLLAWTTIMWFNSDQDHCVCLNYVSFHRETMAELFTLYKLFFVVDKLNQLGRGGES